MCTTKCAPEHVQCASVALRPTLHPDHFHQTVNVKCLAPPPISPTPELCAILFWAGKICIVYMET